MKNKINKIEINKKMIALISAAVLAFGLTACAGQNDGGNNNSSNSGTVVDNGTTDNGAADSGNTSGSNTEGSASVEITNATGAFEAIWNCYSEDQKYPIIGGDMSHVVDNAPGAYDLGDKDGLMGLYYIPEGQVSAVDDVATAMHMMNANTFTGVVVHVADAKAFADATKTNIEGTQWICGFPDRLVIYDLSGGYVAYAFGEASIMKDFAENLEKAFPSAAQLYNINLAE